MKKLKTVNKIKNPGLAKLPKEVRNKMGYMKKGGEAEAKEKLRVARGAAARVGSSNAMLEGRPLSRIKKKILENSKKESLNLLKGKGPTAREKAIKEFSKMDRKPMMKKGGKLKKVAEILTPVPRKESGKFDDPFIKGNKKRSGEEKGAGIGFALGTLAGGPLGALAGMLAGKYAGRAKEMNSIIKAAEKRAGKKLSPTRKKFIKAFTLAERKGMDKFTFDGKEYSTKRKQMKKGGKLYKVGMKTRKDASKNLAKLKFKKREKMKALDKNIKGDIAKPTMMGGGQVQAPSQIGDAVATYQGSGNYKAGE